MCVQWWYDIAKLIPCFGCTFQWPYDRWQSFKSYEEMARGFRKVSFVANICMSHFRFGPGLQQSALTLSSTIALFAPLHDIIVDIRFRNHHVQFVCQ